MSLWTMIFLIVMAGLAYAAWQRHTDAKYGIVRDVEGNPVLDGSARNQREAELQAEIKQLRERLEVLEKITVDDRSAKQIAAEIESLRDN